mmetsp:Transcript_25777/g.30203  ORF Transcript_25777/g.30203 Transcript_25777/m.30203 type:complete len:80 (-) Transcript_25777:36-275(-)
MKIKCKNKGRNHRENHVMRFLDNRIFKEGEDYSVPPKSRLDYNPSAAEIFAERAAQMEQYMQANPAQAYRQGLPSQRGG